MARLFEFIGNHLFLVCLLMSLLAFLLWDIFSHVVQGVKLLLPQETTQLINREDAKVVDVRSQSEFEQGHILGAINLSGEALATKQDRLKPYQEQGIILCCNNGMASTKQARTFIMAGYSKIYCLKGGLDAWQNASLPLAKGVK